MFGLYTSKVDYMGKNGFHEGSTCSLIFTHNSRSGVPIKMGIDKLPENTYIHASYGTKIQMDKLDGIGAELKKADELKSPGVVFHLPKNNINEVAMTLKAIKKRFKWNTRILLEMHVYRPVNGVETFHTTKSLNYLCKLFKSYGYTKGEIGICLDSSHIFVYGDNLLQSYDEVEEYFLEFDDPEWIGMIHLNGNETKPGQYRDKHAIPFDKVDRIWGEMKEFSEDSGFVAFIDWSKNLQIPTIFELKMKGRLEFFQRFVEWEKEQYSENGNDEEKKKN